MPLFRKKPAIWFVLRHERHDWKREGPYTRQNIADMYASGSLGGGALLWTNEKIFANPKKPNSSRLVRIEKWSRFDELPDPTQNDLIALARRPEGAPLPPGAPVAAPPHPAYPADHTDGADDAVPPPPPPPGGYATQQQYDPPQQQPYAPPPQTQHPAPAGYPDPQYAPYPAPDASAHPAYPLPAQAAQPPPPPPGPYPGPV